MKAPQVDAQTDKVAWPDARIQSADGGVPQARAILAFIHSGAVHSAARKITRKEKCRMAEINLSKYGITGTLGDRAQPFLRIAV